MRVNFDIMKDDRIDQKERWDTLKHKDQLVCVGSAFSVTVHKLLLYHHTN